MRMSIHTKAVERLYSVTFVVHCVCIANCVSLYVPIDGRADPPVAPIEGALHKKGEPCAPALEVDSRQITVDEHFSSDTMLNQWGAAKFLWLDLVVPEFRMPELPGPERLQRLRVIGWRDDLVTVDLESLSNCRGMRVIHCERLRIDSLAPLGRIPGLVSLRLHQCEVRQWQTLGELKQLRHLLINDTTIIDLAPLSKLTHLEQLTIYPVKQVKTLLPLTAIKSLQRLSLNACLVRRSALLALRSANPHLRIAHTEPEQ